jgi:hypothetical protein
MKPTTKPRPEEAPDEIAAMAMDMIRRGERSRTLSSFTVNLQMVVIDAQYADAERKTKGGSR